MYMYMCIYIYIYTHISAYIYIYIYILKSRSPLASMLCAHPTCFSLHRLHARGVAFTNMNDEQPVINNLYDNDIYIITIINITYTTTA